MTTTLKQIQSDHNTQDNTVQESQFTLRLSVSLKQVHSKEDGKTVKQYDVCKLDSQQTDALRIIFKTKNYSTNVWNGSRHSTNYVGMTGVALDFDGGLTISEAREAFSPYNVSLQNKWDTFFCELLEGFSS
jgi:hypothetical protein